LQAKALKFILLDQFVEVDVEQLENYAHVIAEYEIIEPKSKQKDIFNQLAYDTFHHYKKNLSL
jgi:hypothetical protein